MKTYYYTQIITCICIPALTLIGGCGIQGLGDYSNEWLYPEDIQTVYVQMFDTKSFRRGFEYTLTDAVCKRIETNTPYKIVSNRDQADTLLTGRLTIYSGQLSRDLYTGGSIENEAIAAVSVSWKDLRTGQLMVNNSTVTATGTYSPKLSQSFNYAAAVAVNDAAVRIVELMEKKW